MMGRGSLVAILFFFFNDTPTDEIYTAQYTLSLHDALPILSWLKLNDSLTASALTMPRRTRSWISLSSSAAREPPRSLLSPCSTASVFRAAPCLATVPPSNDHAEPDVQAAEPRGHEPVAPRRRPEQRRGT